MPDPVSPSTGDLIDKAFWDTEVYDRWVDLLAAWTPYTPVWTTSGAAPTPGTTTIVGRYKLIGKTCHFHLRFVYGTGVTTPSGQTWFLSMPFPASLDTVGIGRITPGGTNPIPVAVTLQTSGRMWFTRYDGAIVGGSTITGWANGNYIVAAGTYEIA